jgi:hypothetical protein
MAVPDSSPRAPVVVSVRNPQRVMLADGAFFPPGYCAVPWGRASTAVGVAPKALQERGCSCKVFPQRLSVCEVLVSTGIGDVSASLGGAVRMYQHSSTFGASPGGVALSPRAWAHSRRSGRALRLVCTSLRHPSAGWRCEASTTPIERVANRGFLVELLAGDSSGRPCPVR